jgi:hypothetical protein
VEAGLTWSLYVDRIEAVLRDACAASHTER